MLFRNIILTTALLLSAGIAGAAELLSPDGNVKLTFDLTAQGEPSYTLSYKDKPVVNNSLLGLKLKGGKDLVDGFVIAGETTSSFDETWRPVWGEESEIRNNYNELAVTLEQPATGRRMLLRFRAFDDGAGLRYEFQWADGDMQAFTIADERTEFAIPSDATAYWIPGDNDSQEYNYTRSRLSEIRSNMDAAHVGGPLFPSLSSPTGVQTALMMKYDDGLYVNIHEAAVLDYPAMNLSLDEARQTFVSDLVPSVNGEKALMRVGDVTPWRTLIVSDDARDILASRMTLNLNEPCRIEDTSWIKPMKYVGVWWEMITGKSTWTYTDDVTAVRIGETDYSKLKSNGRHGANTANVMKYIDFAARHGFDGVLIEGWNEGWEDCAFTPKETVYSFTKPYPDFDIEQISAYARDKGVSLVMHHETSSAVRDYERNLDEAFRFMNKYGYTGVKGGYIGELSPRGEHHYSQSMVNHYHYVVDKAADYKIMCFAHEAIRPTGVCRTYPNLMANESTRGSEYHAFSGINPGHTAILPFTRLIGGPIDYTPGLFENDISKYNPYSKAWVNTTLANQLSLYVTMSSPIQMAADLPETYERFADAFLFIKDVALDWDKSVYLEGEPMEYVTVARKAKNSDDWFVGCSNGIEPRVFEIDFSFLPAGQKYQATIYRDGKNAHYRNAPQDYVIETKTVTSKSKLKLWTASSGGYAIRLTPLR